MFINDAVTVYPIDPGARSGRACAGEDFAGVLQCDCFLVYDSLAYDYQKHLQYLLRAVTPSLRAGAGGQWS